MSREAEAWLMAWPEPQKGCLLAVSDLVLSQHEDVALAWKYGMPFFTFRNKMFCYLWVDKKSKEPYLGMVEGKHLEHPLLEQGNRSRMKILRLNSYTDLPITEIQGILSEALDLYLNGVISTK